MRHGEPYRMTTDNNNPIMWEPSQTALEKANLTHFARAAIKRWKLRVNTYPDFHRWSIEQPGQFWQSVWEQLGVIGTPAEPKKGVRAPLGLKERIGRVVARQAAALRRDSTGPGALGRRL